MRNVTANSIYADDELVRQVTAYAVFNGHRILQVHRLAPDDESHVARLLGLFAPPPKARVLDMACGIGEVSRIMGKLRPDLDITLLNISRSQLVMCPQQFERVEADCHETPFDGASFDGVMINYALGHMDLDDAIAEVSRILKPGGILFVFDLTGGYMPSVAYTAHDVEDVVASAKRHGLGEFAWINYPKTIVAPLRNMVGDEALAELTDGIAPVIYRFEKRGLAIAV